ncbi:MAG: hypothetical protein AVO35_08230 [Candidatus Aegiribacteria sp. MLS_C]|nr:MAG: hypothetical protein AVO35_08230 [Candidatus Aegiribacteria sp. MLS_C]
MIENLIEYLSANSPGTWAVPLLVLIAFAETLFPPIPGDVLFIVMTGWARAGGLHPAAAAACGFAGCMLASCILFYIGHRPGRQFIEGWLQERVDPSRVDRARELVSKHGPLVLALSRFVPGIRSLLVLMAGSSGMRFAVAAVPVAFSAAAWYTILSAAGSVLGRSLDSARGFMDGLELLIWVVLGGAVLFFLAWWLVTARRRG